MAKWADPIPCGECKGRGYHHIPTSTGYAKVSCSACDGTGIAKSAPEGCVNALMVILGVMGVALIIGYYQQRAMHVGFATLTISLVWFALAPKPPRRM